MGVVFVDTETTGLDPDRHVLWEVALIYRETDRPMVFQRELSAEEFAEADPGALMINRYYERLSDAHVIRESDGVMAKMIAHALAGATLAGIGPWFDARFLQNFLRRNGQALVVDHRLVDCKTLAVGALLNDGAARSAEEREARDRLQEPPFETRDLATALGVDRGDAHTALADARLAQKFYEFALGRP